LDCALLNGAEPEMPKPADLAVLGLRPHNYFTATRSLSTLTAAAARNGVLGRVDAHLTEVSSRFQQTTTSAQDFAAAGKAGCSIGGGSTAVVSA
jgi:hypothetical protein